MNKYRPCVYVLPEDEALDRVATGFAGELAEDRSRAFNIAPPTGGWKKTIAQTKDLLKKHNEAYIVLLVDFDKNTHGAKERRSYITSDFSAVEQGRVFVIGASDEIEKLTASLKASRDEIGQRVARECRDRVLDLWEHEMLKHNKAEVERMNDKLHDILFGD